MALTPEDVVNKRFQATKFREGYDQDEVDDFLDDVVVELRRLNQENDELRQRLMQSDARINELQNAAPQQSAAPQQAAPPQMAPPQMAPPQGAPVGYGAPDANSMDPGNTNNLLQLARTLHEQHVREGMEKRDALIAEGQAAAERAVQEGQAAAERAIQEAQAQQRSALNGLEQERQALESRVDELRNFERDYRAKLKGYIEGQLRELDASSVSSQPAAPQQRFEQQPQPAYSGSPLLTNPPQAMPQPGMPPQGMPPQGMPLSSSTDSTSCRSTSSSRPSPRVRVSLCSAKFCSSASSRTREQPSRSAADTPGSS
jgi:DivIVA domain-containing protein